MKNTLTNCEIKKRLLRLHNLEKMYANQVKSNKKIKEENKRLKAENLLLRKENKELRDRIEKLELIVEELQKMIFKKKHKSDK
jgi:regulator of replication initiation timing